MRPVLAALTAMASRAQTTRPIESPEVSPDGGVTIRFRDPNAKEVAVAFEGIAKPVAMRRDSSGIWAAKIGPLQPDYYGYTIAVDGVNLIDPNNPRIQPSLLWKQSMVHVPGPPSLPWELNDVPHGALHHHFYKSIVIGDQRDFFVYTPPGYDRTVDHAYPVLYLLHGFGDDASGWTAVGRAHVILDNLIDAGETRPLIAVMTLGYGDPEFLRQGHQAFSRADLLKRHYDNFAKALFAEVMPRVEKAYRTAADRNSRAIAGLSMGAVQSLHVGLNRLDEFGYIGAFSAGGFPDNHDATFAGLSGAEASKLKLLWMACGTEDRAAEPTKKFRKWLDGKKVRHTYCETPGMHVWTSWRRHLAAFAPMLFQASSSSALPMSPASSVGTNGTERPAK